MQGAIADLLSDSATEIEVNNPPSVDELPTYFELAPDADNAETIRVYDVSGNTIYFERGVYSSGVGTEHLPNTPYKQKITSQHWKKTVDAIEQGYLSEDDSLTIVRDSASQFTVEGVDRTSLYTEGRVLRFNGSDANIAIVESSNLATSDTEVTLKSGTVPNPLTKVELAIGARGANNLTALISALQAGSYQYAADSGAADAYVVDLDPAVTAYTAGMAVVFKAANANTTTSTVNVNSLGTKTIKKNVTDDLEAGDIVADQIVVLIYDGTNFQAIGLSAATEVSVKANLYQNAIINGNFDVWQRGTSFSTNGAYTADRWRLNLSGATGSVTRQDFALGQTDVPNEPKHYLRLATTVADDNTQITTRIESVRTLAGKDVTLTFYAKAASATTYQVVLRQFFGTGGSPSTTVELTENISVTTAWQKFTITKTLGSISGKTLGSDGNDYLEISIVQTANTTFTLDLSQFQLNEGTVATSFMPKSYDEELFACQRYCYVPPTPGTGSFIGFGMCISNALARIFVNFPNTMRRLPTLTATASDWQIDDSAAGTDVTAINNTDEATWNTTRMNNLRIGVSGTPFTDKRPCSLKCDGTANRVMIFDAEL